MPFLKREHFRPGFLHLCCLSLVLALSIGGSAAATNEPLLTIERLFDGKEFDGESVEQVVWRQAGPGYYTFEKEEQGSGKELVRHDPATGQKELILPAHALIPPGGSSPLGIDGWEFSKDESKLLLFTNSKRVWRQNTRGDYWVLDITSRELRQLGGDAAPSTLMFAKFSPDGRRVAFVRENNLYVQNLADLSIQPITTNGSATLINGTFDWVYEEELYLRDGFRWSPDGERIAYWQIDSSGVREFPLLNNTDTFYPGVQKIPYPKTGEQNSAARVGVAPSGGGATTWMKLPGDPRNHYPARMNWASNSTELIVQQFNRKQNTNLVMLGEAQTGEVRVILTETDAAWVENDNPVYWIQGGRSFVWLSERDGWMQAYRVSRDGTEVSRITHGRFDVISVEVVDEKGGWLYYIASPENPAQRYLYRVRLSGGESDRLSPADQPGWHSYNISPAGEWAVHTFSDFKTPPVTKLVKLPEHKEVRTLEENKALREKISALAQPVLEFFEVEIESGVKLNGWSIKPPSFDPARKHPVLFFVYGEPAGQTVVDRWPGKRHLWHWMLAQQGYVVMSVDNRGTPAPRGRDWRKAIYGRIGSLNTADQAAAVKALLEKQDYLDAKRLAVWGWSGGGSSTLNALLQYPDLYHTGMAVAPVANQRYYDTIYQERYMGLPHENPEGYRKGSPLTHARNLKGKLLIVHGTGDDNVHYQGTEALINEFIAYNKPFTMMAYPNRRHGISEGKNTTRHLYTLLTRFLTENLPPGQLEAEAARVEKKQPGD